MRVEELTKEAKRARKDEECGEKNESAEYKVWERRRMLQRMKA